MVPTYNDLAEVLKDKQIRISYQRLKVLEYITQNHTHPSVDQIYHDLHKDIPTLSKTTIYNTLNVLLDANIIRAITIDNNETRYDILMEDHGHFRCEKCRRIFNFTISPEVFHSKDLQHFLIKDKNIYFDGICPDCL